MACVAGVAASLGQGGLQGVALPVCFVMIITYPLPPCQPQSSYPAILFAKRRRQRLLRDGLRFFLIGQMRLQLFQEQRSRFGKYL